MSDSEEAPSEVHHYKSLQEVPWDIQKYMLDHWFWTSADLFYSYWAQRYRIFSKYDDGIWLTDDAWFGVTPEPVAKCVIALRFVNLDC